MRYYSVEFLDLGKTYEANASAAVLSQGNWCPANRRFIL
jgi:hypothetical protein